MSKYVDVYLLPIPKKNLTAYCALARKAGKVFRENGALEYREFVIDDIQMPGLPPFTKAVKLKPGEVAIVAIVGYSSRRHRDSSNNRIMKDPRMMALMPKKPIFDMKRMAVGGFSNIVDA